MFEIGAKLDEVALEKKPKVVQNETIKPKNAHEVVFKFEKRKGKPTTLVGRFFISLEDKKELLSLLKKKISCGGGLEDEWIVLQGDCKQKVVEVLSAEGWKIKK